jgi:hypothetical protein
MIDAPSDSGPGGSGQTRPRLGLIEHEGLDPESECHLRDSVRPESRTISVVDTTRSYREDSEPSRTCQRVIQFPRISHRRLTLQIRMCVSLQEPKLSLK